MTTLFQEMSFKEQLMDTLVKLSDRFDVVLEYAYDEEDNGHLVRVKDAQVWKSTIFNTYKARAVFELMEIDGYEPILFLAPQDNNFVFEPSHTLKPKSFVEYLFSGKVDFNILNRVQVNINPPLIRDFCIGSSFTLNESFYNSNSYIQGA